jgi:hypothetical protein
LFAALIGFTILLPTEVTAATAVLETKQTEMKASVDISKFLFPKVLWDGWVGVLVALIFGLVLLLLFRVRAVSASTAGQIDYSERFVFMQTAFVPLRALDPTAKVRTDYRHARHRARVVLIGVAIGHYWPVVSASNFDNELAAVVNRGCLMKKAVPEKAWEEFWSWIEIHFEEIFPGWKYGDRPTAEKFGVWNARFTASQRERHVKARQKTKVNPFSMSWCVRKSFVKVERLNKSEFFEFEEYTPRLIQGCTDEYNVIVGPWAFGVGKWLGRQWDGVKSPLLYSAGHNSERIGAWLGEHRGFLYENDFKYFDGTQALELREMSLRLHSKFGAKRKVLQALRGSLVTHGATPHGVVYSVAGTCNSGEPETSSRNTLWNCLAHFYIWEKQHGRNPFHGGLHMMALGDDGICRSAYVTDWNRLSHLGFFPKPIYRADEWDAEFCSSLFYPTSTGIVLGPKIGRVLPKIGWSEKLISNSKTHMRGVALGLVDDVWHIPIMKDYFEMILRLTSGAHATPIKDEHKFHVSRRHHAIPETWAMLSNRYGVSVPALKQLGLHFGGVTRLPATVRSPLWEALYRADN